MNHDFSDAELEAFLEEALDPVRAAEIEQTARTDSSLLRRLAFLNRLRDHGAHSLAAIWRRFQVAVPSREEMGQYLLGILEPEHAGYIEFRLDILKCPFTQSLLAELKAATDQAEMKRAKACRDSLYQSGTQIIGRTRKS